MNEDKVKITVANLTHIIYNTHTHTHCIFLNDNKARLILAVVSKNNNIIIINWHQGCNL